MLTLTAESCFLTNPPTFRGLLAPHQDFLILSPYPLLCFPLPTLSTGPEMRNTEIGEVVVVVVHLFKLQLFVEL